MSRKYEKESEVPTTVICQRLIELSEAITEGKKGIEREFTMRVPSELDRDPDLVMSIAASRLSRLQAENERLNRVFQNQGNLREEIVGLREQLRTAEQRVARECWNIINKGLLRKDMRREIELKYGI